MTVVVQPERFTLVAFDAGRIAAVVGAVAAEFGLPDDLVITVAVDESTPLARAQLRSVEPPVLDVEGGAFESPRVPRQLDEEAVAVIAARLLGRVRDRLDPHFGAPPSEAELTVALADAWDAYCLGRAERSGFGVYQPRWRYRFRTRHGFSDVADRVFDRLWAGEGLRWADLEAAAAETEQARAPAPG